ncbi:MAG: hypothetical protein FJ095_11655 [Deltaproteobacteria bacterium]|nr:hypothetical protein [Deltaproteobacteria bacterium]
MSARRAVLAAAATALSAGCTKEEPARPKPSKTDALVWNLTPEAQGPGLGLPSPCVREGAALRTVVLPTTRLYGGAALLDALLATIGEEGSPDAGILRMTPGVVRAEPIALTARTSHLAVAGPPWLVASVSHDRRALSLVGSTATEALELARGEELALDGLATRQGEVAVLASAIMEGERRGFVLLGSYGAASERWRRVELPAATVGVSIEELRPNETLLAVREPRRASWLRVRGDTVEPSESLELDTSPLATSRRGDEFAALTTMLAAPDGSGGVRLATSRGSTVTLRSPEPAKHAWLRRVGDGWLALWRSGDGEAAPLHAALVIGDRALGPVTTLGGADDVIVASTWDRVVLWLRRGTQLTYVKHRCPLGKDAP